MNTHKSRNERKAYKEGKKHMALLLISTFKELMNDEDKLSVKQVNSCIYQAMEKVK